MSKSSQKRIYDVRSVRIYDAGKKFADYLDRFSAVFLIPKRDRKKESFRGLYLGCSPSGEDGFIKCCWNEISDNERINSQSLYLGKRIRLENMPEGFRKAIEQICISFYEYDY